MSTKLREIKEVVRIRCKTKEEATQLTKTLAKACYRWNGGASLSHNDLWECDKENTVYTINPENKRVTVGKFNGDKVSKMSSIIISEEESAAIDVIDQLKRLCQQNALEYVFGCEAVSEPITMDFVLKNFTSEYILKELETHKARAEEINKWFNSEDRKEISKEEAEKIMDEKFGKGKWFIV